MERGFCLSHTLRLLYRSLFFFWMTDYFLQGYLAESLIEKCSFDPKYQMESLLSVVEEGIPQ